MPKKNENVWDRLPKETAPAFKAFQTYRDMGADRSNAKVGQKLSKSKTLIDRWSSRNFWVSRVRAYDMFLDTEAQKSQIETAQVMAQRHKQTAQVILNKVVQKLNAMVQSTELTATQAIRWFEVGVKMERISHGEASEIVETKDAGADSQMPSLKGLPKEKLKILAEWEDD